MLKFINSLAVIEVNKEVGAIQVTFRGTGSIYHYLETTRIAAGFASLHHTHSYLIVKKAFEDISPAQFYDVIEAWFRLLDGNKNNADKVKMALLLNPDTFLEISQHLHKVRQEAPDDGHPVAFDIFFTEQQASTFLRSKPFNMTYQSI